MANQTTKYIVVKTVCRELEPNQTKSGKREFISDRFYYKGGSWLAEWIKDGASRMSKNKAKSLVLNLDCSDEMITYDWLKAT